MSIRRKWAVLSLRYFGINQTPHAHSCDMNREYCDLSHDSYTVPYVIPIHGCQD